MFKDANLGQSCLTQFPTVGSLQKQSESQKQNHTRAHTGQLGQCPGSQPQLKCNKCQLKNEKQVGAALLVTYAEQFMVKCDHNFLL